MAPKGARGEEGPPLDPFGANDPAWERYYGISWLRRIVSPGGRRGGRRPRRGELLSAMVVGALALLLAVAGITVVFWLLGRFLD